MMNLCQEYKNYKIKVTQHLFLITKIVVLNNLHNLKKRINNCNHKLSQTFKGANDYDKQNYIKEKEKQINT